MTFNDYLLTLITYILSDVRVYIAEINQDIDRSIDFDHLPLMEIRLSEELLAEKKWEDLHSRLIESHESGLQMIRSNDALLHDLWDHARDGFCDSVLAQNLSYCDDQILGEGHRALSALVKK